MTNDRSIEHRLEVLADSLQQCPCIADRVAQSLENKRHLTPKAATGSHRQLAFRRCWIAGAVVVATTVVFAFAILGDTASIGFAQVQAALQNVRTVIISRSYPEHPEMRQRLLASVDNDAYRTEHSNGAVFVQMRNGKSLLMNTKNRTAQVTPSSGFGREGEMPGPVDYLKSLQKIEAYAVSSLGSKKFDGRILIGFELPPVHGAKRQVWVDPMTKLPVREEVAKIGDVSGTGTGFAAYRMPRCISFYDFNVEITIDAFSMTPAGYKIVDSREFQAPWLKELNAPDGIGPEQLVITPGIGIGAIKFGMSQDDVVTVLGKPDQEMMFGAMDEDEDEERAFEEFQKRADAEGMDAFERYRESRRILNRKPQHEIKKQGVRLHYYSLGLDIEIDDEDRMDEFKCYARMPIFVNFTGRTVKGISMSSSVQDVKSVFGEPSRVHEGEGYSRMLFKKSRIEFMFNRNGEITQIVVSEPSA